jgi:MarR family transcriptional regulator, 2-MHQ and catechol-resistance regulon repressor
MEAFEWVKRERRTAKVALHCTHRTRPFSGRAFCEQEGHQAAPPHPSKPARYPSQGWGVIDLLLRACNEGGLRPRVARAQEINSPHSLSSLDHCSNTDYSFAMDLPDLKDDPYLKVLRPLVETYLAFWRIDTRHIKSLRLTPSQFDVIATLGDTEGMTCSELSAQTLVTKGTLTGVLDRLVSKGLIRRDAMKGDRRCTKISLTVKGDALFRKTFTAHLAFLRPFFERALSPEEVNQTRALLLRLRDSFQQ